MAGEIIRYRMALNVAPSRQSRLNASIGTHRIEVDDVAQKDPVPLGLSILKPGSNGLLFVEFVVRGFDLGANCTLERL